MTTTEAAARARRFGRVRGRTVAIIVAVLGTAIGLLIAQPWQPPPLLAPVGVDAGFATATSVRVDWQVAPGSLQPSGFLVLRDGRPVGSTSGKALSYIDRGLVPGGTYAYTVVATAGGQRSKVSAGTSVTTIAPVPTHLTQTGRDWTSVTLTWSPPPDVPAPHLYDVIDESNSGVIIAQVPGRVHSYTVTGLAPDGSGQYGVDASWSGTWSGTTPAVTATTRLAPLDHDYAVKYTTTAAPGGGASLHVGQTWTDDWTFTPACAGAQCATIKAQVNFDPPDFSGNEIDMTLRLSGGSYVGTTTSKVTQCGDGVASTPLQPNPFGPTQVTDTISVAITPDKTRGGQWTAWHAAMQLASPYTVYNPVINVVGQTQACPAQSWSFTVAGRPSSSG